MVQRSPRERPTARQLAQHEFFPANFSRLYEIIKKHKLFPREKFSITGDDILPQLESSGDLEFILSLPPDECVIPLSLILSAMQNIDFQSTKFRSFKIIAQLTKTLSDQIVFERIFPIILKFAKCTQRSLEGTINDDPQVRSRALLTIRDVLLRLNPENIHPRECKLFHGFLTDLSMHSKDALFSVRRTFARIIGDLSEVSIKFTERANEEKTDGNLNLVKKSLAETTTVIMTDRSSEIKQTFLHFSVKKLAYILGQGNTGDIILKHMITYLNDKHNVQLRAEFYNVLPDVVASINHHSTEVLGALIKQGLVDSHDLVIKAALQCFVRLITMNLMSKYLALEVASEAAPLLLYPNSGILTAAAAFFAALAKQINTAERLVQLYPIILPYFRKPNKAAFDSVTSILTFLRKPLTRSVYDVIVDQFKKFLTDGKNHTLEDFIGRLPKDPSIDIDQIDLVEHKDYDVLLRHIRNVGKIDHDDITALGLMSGFITEQVRKAGHSNMIWKHYNFIDIEQVEKDQRRCLRNYCKVSPEQNAALDERRDEDRSRAKSGHSWYRPYRSHVRQDDNLEFRMAISRCALKSTISQKRNAYRVKMVEDLNSICLDWDADPLTAQDQEDMWTPRGRLVAHVHQHGGAINQVALNSNNQLLVSASDDGSIRIWNTDQFGNHSKASSEYKSKNNWTSPSGQKIKRASFTEPTKVAVVTNTSLHYLNTENLKSSENGWSLHFDAKKDGIITDMITSPSIEDKGEILVATSFGHIIGYDPRVGSEVYRLNHNLRHGFITSICGDKRQHWAAAASSRGFVTVFDLRFHLKCRSFSVSDDGSQVKINKIITHPTEPCHLAASIDGNNNVGVWNLESGLRDYALWASSLPPLSTERDASNHSVRALTYTSDGQILFTGGTDRRIRSWVMAKPSASEIVAQAATDQTDGLRVTVGYSERKMEGFQLIHETSKRQRVQHEESDWGLLGAPQGHWDSISSLQVLQVKNQKLLLSASRDGVMKVWK